ncbi:MAG: TIGR02186 family protein, partial [Alphaproteobacteria bacterium]
YSAEIFLIRDGEVISAETTPLFIDKTGFQAEINYAARTQPALYGLAAIAIALAAGWGAAAVFRKT